MVDNISARDLKVLIREEKAIIIDVRTSAEFEEMQIYGSYHKELGSFTLKDIKDLISKEEKNKTVVFLCRSGVRSQTAIEQIEEEAKKANLSLDFDYKNAEGGIIACANNGITVLKD